MNFKQKRLLAYSLFGVLLIGLIFFVVLAYNDLFLAAVLATIALVPLVLLLNSIVSDSLFRVVDGTSLLCLTLDSSGYVVPYDVKVVEKPLLQLNFFGKKYNWLYDRRLIFNLQPPKEGIMQEEPNGDLLILLKKEARADALFRLGGAGNRPMLIFNPNIHSFISKEVLSSTETNVMVKHLSNLILDKMRRLEEYIIKLTKNFADHFAPDLLGELLQNRIFQIIVVIIALILLYYVGAPYIQQFISGASQGAGNVLSVTGGQPTDPIPVT